MEELFRERIEDEFGLSRCGNPPRRGQGLKRYGLFADRVTLPGFGWQRWICPLTIDGTRRDRLDGVVEHA